MPASRRAGVRCLVLGRYPEPDLEMVARLAGSDRVELVRPDPEGGRPGDGHFDCVWRLFGSAESGPEALLALLQNHPEVTWVHTTSAGVDALEPLLRAHPEIILTNSAGVVATPIAEFVVGCLLQHRKRAAELWGLQAERRFQELSLRELAGATVTILGLGAIGSATARILAAFDCRLVGVRRHPGRGADGFERVLPPSQLGEACRASDALVLAAPLTAETRGLVDSAVLSQMAPRSCLVNVARGPLLVEAALLGALRDGPLGAAYLDVFEEEPLPPDSPLWSLPGVFVSPHVSWSSPNFARRASQLFGEQLRRFLEGEPLRNRSDPVEGY